MFEPDGLLGGGSLCDETLLQPGQSGGDRRILVAEPLEQLHACCSRQLVGQDSPERGRRGFRRTLHQSQQTIGDFVSLLACVSAEHDLFGQTPQVLDEEDAQADGDGPELTDRQRLDLLVGDDHSPKALRIEATVGVGQIRPGKAKYPWIAGQMTVGQLW